MRPTILLLLLPVLLSPVLLCAQVKDSSKCSICKNLDSISALEVHGEYYLVVSTAIKPDAKTDAKTDAVTKAKTDTIKVGTDLSAEVAEKRYHDILTDTLRTMWDRDKVSVSASAYTAYVTGFISHVLATFFPATAPVPELVDSIRISPATFVGLVKDQHSNFVISVYGAKDVTDVFAFDDKDYAFRLDDIKKSPALIEALPAVVFLKNKIAGVSRPDLVLSKRKGGGYDLTLVSSDGDSIPTGIAVDGHLARGLQAAILVQPPYKQHLLGRPNYVNDISKKLNSGCAGCALSPDETLLVYDHQCQQFLYKPAGSDSLRVLDNLNKVNVQFKKPVRVTVVNFNRYIYNLTLASSDISLTSQESTVMQTYLLPGSTNGQVSPTNTYVNSGSSNGADFVFGNIANFKASVDRMLNNIKKVTLMDIRPVALTDVLQILIEVDPKNDTLHNKRPTAPTLKDFYEQNTTAEKYELFLQETNNIVANIKVKDLDTVKAFKFPSKLTPDSVKKTLQHFNDSVIKVLAQAEYLKTVNVLKGDFYHLRRYCDSFIDNRIRAYSLCTDDFPCCKTPEATYDEFEQLLNNVSNQLFAFRVARTKYNNVMMAKPASPTPPSKQEKSTPPRQNGMVKAGKDTTAINSTAGKLAVDTNNLKFVPTAGIAGDSTTTPTAGRKGDTTAITLNITGSDILVSDGKITGLRLEQRPDTAKAKKASEPDDPADVLDTLWYSFEKSIPTDYIMRQIIFRNNMIRENMSYTSPPIFPYGDRLGLVIQMPVADTVKRMGTMPANTTTFSVDFPVFGKPLFSFSAGSFLGFFVNKRTYEWQQVPTPGSNTVQPTSPYRLAYTGPGALPAGLDGMANLTWRVNCFKNWKHPMNNVWFGITGGVGAVVDQPTVRIGYLLGGTFSFGTYQQFHIGIGAMAMNVNVLKDDLSTAQYYQSQPTESPYNTKLQPGGFLSVSYTVFSPRSSGTMQNQVINAN